MSLVLVLSTVIFGFVIETRHACVVVWWLYTRAILFCCILLGYYFIYNRAVDVQTRVCGVFLGYTGTRLFFYAGGRGGKRGGKGDRGGAGG